MSKIEDFINSDAIFEVLHKKVEKKSRRRKVDEEEKVEIDCSEIEESMVRISELPINRGR